VKGSIRRGTISFAGVKLPVHDIKWEAGPSRSPREDISSFAERERNRPPEFQIDYPLDALGQYATVRSRMPERFHTEAGPVRFLPLVFELRAVRIVSARDWSGEVRRELGLCVQVEAGVLERETGKPAVLNRTFPVPLSVCDPTAPALSTDHDLADYARRCVGWMMMHELDETAFCGPDRLRDPHDPLRPERELPP
jgi:hypothetical protein